MAMIQCRECNNTVSGTVPACPHCGAPLALATALRAANDTPGSTIKETGNRLKLQILISAYLWWGGVIWVFVTMKKVRWPPPSSGIGFLLLVVGSTWYFAAKLRLRRHHKLHRKRRILTRR